LICSLFLLLDGKQGIFANLGCNISGAISVLNGDEVFMSGAKLENLLVQIVHEDYRDNNTPAHSHRPLGSCQPASYPINSPPSHFGSD